MSGVCQKIDFSSWPRREIFSFFFLAQSAVLQCLLPRGRDTAARIHQSARPVFLLRHDISRHTGGQRG